MWNLECERSFFFFKDSRARRRIKNGAMARTEGWAAKRRSTISVFFASPLLSLKNWQLLAVLVCEDLYVGETRVWRRQRAVKSNTGNDKSKLLLLQSLVKFLTTFFTAFFFSCCAVCAMCKKKIAQAFSKYVTCTVTWPVVRVSNFWTAARFFHIMIIDYWRTERYSTMEYGKSER